MDKQVALHNGYDVHIIEVRETPKMYVTRNGVRFKKVSKPTPDRIGELLSNGSELNGFVMSEVDSDVVKKKLDWNKSKNLTQQLTKAIVEKFECNLWKPEQMNHLTIEQAKHLNEYLSLGLDIKE